MDAFLSDHLPEVSRARLKTCIQDGLVAVNTTSQTKPSYACRIGDVIAGTLPEPPLTTAEPEDIPLAVVHEDEDVVIVNKAAGMLSSVIAHLQLPPSAGSA